MNDSKFDRFVSYVLISMLDLKKIQGDWDKVLYLMDVNNIKTLNWCRFNCVHIVALTGFFPSSVQINLIKWWSAEQ